jgi:hypothetical protein
MWRITAICLALAAAGCSSGPGGGGGKIDPGDAALQEVADLIRATSPAPNRGPGKLADFDRMEAQYPRGYQAVKSGDVVVVWGATVAGEGGGGGSDAVVAYEKKVTTDRGYVLLQNGTTREMTADQLKAAPKTK